MTPQSVGATQPDPGADFERDVAPILIRRCVECHNARESSGGLDLTRRDTALAGGDSGPVIQPGKPADSYLLDRVVAGEMPPEEKGESRKLPAAEREALRRWIASGAAWPDNRRLDLFERTTDVRAGRDWWSLRPVKRPAVPAIDSTEAASPIDAFVAGRLNERGMAPAPRADRRVLIRRVYQDLIGLPPTYQQIEAFAADEAPDAWPRLVDRLLASPRYGERWSRHWLDLVRFAETSGYERDQEKPHAWKYRDWVVSALNDDMPYDRFVVHQLAGDEIPDRTERSAIATGMLRLGTWNDEPNDPQDYKYDRLEDLVHVTATAFLGLTVKCARCHDHKFDPIPQTDYYRMASVFWSGPIEPRDRNLLGGPSDEELGLNNVLAWTDVNARPSPLRLLKAGNRHQPGPVVEPRPLSLLPELDQPFEPPAEDASTSGRRLQLARWIARSDNPLTARVIANRLWLHHFGQGLVRTPNNFGFRGEPPTHPELLDWLADRLTRNGWRLKPIHRLILLSETYCRSSVHPAAEQYRQRDFDNRLWWRASRRRLDAESLRDALLSVTGELDPRMGGPSFRPSISPEALEGLSRKTAAWQPSPPQEQFRRSLYIFTQRSLLVPMMTTFDFGDTTLPCGSRDVTIVAPQALALMNHRFVHRRALALARRVRSAAGEDRRAQAIAAWKFAWGRTPRDDEIELALDHLTAQERRISATAGDRPATRTTDQDSDQVEIQVEIQAEIQADEDSRPPPDLMALTSLCHVLLNANEFLFVD